MQKLIPQVETIFQSQVTLPSTSSYPFSKLQDEILQLLTYEYSMLYFELIECSGNTNSLKTITNVPLLFHIGKHHANKI
jgi:hypothetical protein